MTKQGEILKGFRAGFRAGQVELIWKLLMNNDYKVFNAICERAKKWETTAASRRKRLARENKKQPANSPAQ